MITSLIYHSIYSYDHDHYYIVWIRYKLLNSFTGKYSTGKRIGHLFPIFLFLFSEEAVRCPHSRVGIQKSLIWLVVKDLSGPSITQSQSYAPLPLHQRTLHKHSNTSERESVQKFFQRSRGLSGHREWRLEGIQIL